MSYPFAVVLATWLRCLSYVVALSPIVITTIGDEILKFANNDYNGDYVANGAFIAIRLHPKLL